MKDSVKIYLKLFLIILASFVIFSCNVKPQKKYFLELLPEFVMTGTNYKPIIFTAENDTAAFISGLKLYSSKLKGEQYKNRYKFKLINSKGQDLKQTLNKSIVDRLWNSYVDNDIIAGKIIFRKACKSCHDMNIKLFAPAIGNLANNSVSFIKKFKLPNTFHIDTLTKNELMKVVYYIQKQQNDTSF